MTELDLERAYGRVVDKAKPRFAAPTVKAKPGPLPKPPGRAPVICEHGKRRWRQPGKPYCKVCYRPYANGRLRRLRAGKVVRQAAGIADGLLYGGVA